VKGRDKLGDHGIDMRIILKWILRKGSVNWTELVGDVV
jgi:hypothetical protein